MLRDDAMPMPRPPWTEPIPPVDFHHFAVPDTAPLQELIRHAYQLARALPPEPLRAFALRTAGMPRSTEAERWVVQRVGQDVFREALDIYWEGRCAVTGVSDRRLLRASHMKPWARCETDAERLTGCCWRRSISTWPQAVTTTSTCAGCRTKRRAARRSVIWDRKRKQRIPRWESSSRLMTR